MASRFAIKTISVSWAEFARLKSQKASLENIVHDFPRRKKIPPAELLFSDWKDARLNSLNSILLFPRLNPFFQTAFHNRN